MLWASLVLLGGMVVIAATLNTIRERVAETGRRVETLLEIRAVQTMTTSWVDVRGLSHSVVTTREAGETPTAFEARHKEALDAALLLFPPKT